MANKKKAIKNKTEKVSEVFDVKNKKTGEEKQIVRESAEKEVHFDKEEREKQQKQLKAIFIVLGVLVLFFIIIFSGLSMIRNPDYKNTEFHTIQEGKLIFYQTSIPVLNNGELLPYNFYLRTNPKDLMKIPFEGSMELKKGYALNLTQEFNCNGDGVISMANLIKQHEVMGIVLIKDNNASCDELNRYNYYEIKEGEETKIVQRGNSSCYDVYVNNCEILPATEKIMAENFAEFNEN